MSPERAKPPARPAHLLHRCRQETETLSLRPPPLPLGLRVSLPVRSRAGKKKGRKPQRKEEVCLSAQRDLFRRNSLAKRSAGTAAFFKRIVQTGREPPRAWCNLVSVPASSLNGGGEAVDSVGTRREESRIMLRGRNLDGQDAMQALSREELGPSMLQARLRIQVASIWTIAIKRHARLPISTMKSPPHVGVSDECTV